LSLLAASRRVLQSKRVEVRKEGGVDKSVEEGSSVIRDDPEEVERKGSVVGDRSRG